MQNMLRRRPLLYRFTLLSGCLLLALLLTGCGEQPPHLDTTNMTGPLGQPGVCEHCNQKIENVTEEHLITVRGNQYTVCDKKCAADLKAWLAKQ